LVHTTIALTLEMTQEFAVCALTKRFLVVVIRKLDNIEAP